MSARTGTARARAALLIAPLVIFLGVFFILVGSPVNVIVILLADKLAGWLQANPKVLRGIDYTFAGVFSVFAFKIFMTQAR